MLFEEKSLIFQEIIDLISGVDIIILQLGDKFLHASKI